MIATSKRILVDRVYELCKPFYRKDHDAAKSGVVASLNRQVYDESLDNEAGVVPDFEDDGIVLIASELGG